jgi:hypothetical protein
MAVVTLPDSLKLEKLNFGRQTFDLPFSNADTGANSTRLLGPPRWTLSFGSAADMNLQEAGEWLSFLLKLKGRINHLEAWDKARPQPVGTCRGQMSLASALAEGATQAVILVESAQAGRSLLPGDWLQIGTGLGTSQLVAVTDPAVASNGTILVNFESPARRDMTAGTSVFWDKPKAYFKSTSAATSWNSERANQGGFSFDGMEQWNA